MVCQAPCGDSRWSSGYSDGLHSFIFMKYSDFYENHIVGGTWLDLAESLLRQHPESVQVARSVRYLVRVDSPRRFAHYEYSFVAFASGHLEGQIAKPKVTQMSSLATAVIPKHKADERCVQFVCRLNALGRVLADCCLSSACINVSACKHEVRRTECLVIRTGSLYGPNGTVDLAAAVRAVLRKPVTKDLPSKLQNKFKMKHATVCTSPSSVTDQFNWASRFINVAMKTWGRDMVLTRLQSLVKEHAQIVLQRWQKSQSASLDLRSAVDFDRRDLVIFENTPGYDVQLLQDELGDLYEIHSTLLKPVEIGFAASRNRVWCILCLRSSCRWTSEKSLAELVKVFHCVPTMKAEDFFHDGANSPAMTLSDMKVAKSYKRFFKESKQVFDLSQRAAQFFRTELKEGHLMTMKTNTKLYCSSADRLMSSAEMCAAMVLPSSKAQATRTYDLENDEHPCQLVHKYVGGAQETFENFGENAMQINKYFFPKKDGKVDIPLFAFRFTKPTEGWPPKVNMDKFAESIFHGFEKDREPLEIQLTAGLSPGEPLFQGCVGVSKGFLRVSIILYGIVQTIMREASLREKKNLLQTALKFQERAVTLMEENLGWSLEHALNEAIAEFNSYGLAAQSAQYRLAEREGFALKALIFGVSAGAQQMMSRHLQVNTWANSAFSVETIRNQRWLIGSAGRSPNPWWQAVDTVSAAKQELFLERLLFSFSVRKKQCRNASTARITGEAWEQLLETSCLLHQILEEMSSAKTAEGGGLFLEEDLVKARRRGIEGDYNTELQNLVTAKMAVVVTDTALWKDHLPTRVSSGHGSTGASAIQALDLECVQKAFAADLLKLSEDQSFFSEYQQKLGAGQRQKALAKVLRLKSENRRGSQQVVDWMDRNAKHCATSYAEQHVNVIEFIRETDAAATIVWVDYTKCGALQQDELDDSMEEVRRILATFPNKGAAVVIAPALTSARVVAGKRGEMRRIEDKMDAKSLISVRFSIRMDANGHGNRRLPLLFPALFACSDGATKNVFAGSKMLVCTAKDVSWLPVREYKVPRTRNATPCTTENMERSLSDAQMAAQYLGGIGVPREDWKSGNHPMGNVEAYNPDFLPEEGGALQPPTLHVCQMVTLEDGSNTLAVNTEFRQKWSDDPTRKDEWARELAAFDTRFGVHVLGEPPRPPVPAAASEAAAAHVTVWEEEPTSGTDLEARYEIVLSCPGRSASTQLRVCKALEKNETAAKNVQPEQLYKLFVAID
ncbi:unnamed protein product [Symbiodinium sp. CCMP2456]|nr:unnamed protein product [Symbiodinium sp. CCMP2456]